MYKTFLASTVLFACLTAPALAEGEGFDYERNPQGSWFLEPNVDVIHIDLPDYDPMAIRSGGPTIGMRELDDGEHVGFNGGLTAGFLAGELLGSNLWFDVSGQAALIDHNDSEQIGNPGPGVSFRLIPVDAQNNGGVNLSGSGGSVLELDRETWFYQGEILARLQFEQEGFSIAPFIGPHVMVIDDEIDTQARRADNQGVFNGDEDVVSIYYGAKLGVNATGDFSPRAGWTVGVHGGVYHLDGNYDASQTSTVHGGNGTFVANRSDDENKFAFAGGLDAGFFVWLGGVRTSLTGGVNYLSDVGKIQSAARFGGGTATPAELDFQDSLMFRGGLEFMIPFN